MRHLHVKLALGFPVVVDVVLNEVLATPDDVWRRFVRTSSQSARDALYVAATGEGCVGMGQVHLEDTVGRLGTLYVADDRRRRGIGSAVVAALQGWALAAGADVLLCHIPDVSAAAPMAEHLGWHRTDEVFGTRHGLQERRWTLAVDR